MIQILVKDFDMFLQQHGSSVIFDVEVNIVEYQYHMLQY